MDSASRDSYLQRIERELTGNILPFWARQVVDRTHGGFFGEIGESLEINPTAIRGSLLTARILWTFSAAFRVFKNPEYLEVARWAHEDLEQRFADRDYGGYFWSATADGGPVDTRKQVYDQAFCIYALTEFARATADAVILDRAIELHRLIETHTREKKFGGYFEALNRSWGVLADVRMSPVDMNLPKSQNTHLHVMEAYSNLLRSWPDPALREAQTELIEVMLSRILDSRTSHLGLFFDLDWSLKTDRISFGHDIEAAWLLHQAAREVGNPKLLQRVQQVAVRIAEVTHLEGLDPDGSLLYEANSQGLTLTYKEWWPQAEGAVGFLDAYQISGDERFLRDALRLWDFIEARLVDRRHGEWFRSVERDGSPARETQPKVSFWKCPYHNGRACLELMDRLRRI